MDNLVFFILSFILGYIWYKWPVWSVAGLKIVIWPCVSAFGIWSVFTYRLFDGTINSEVYWTFFWTFFWAFPAIFIAAQFHHRKKKDNLVSEFIPILDRLEKLSPKKKVEILWNGFKKIFRLLQFFSLYSKNLSSRR